MPSGPLMIVLTGFMAAGKSAVGRLLAARLGRVFLDSDSEIVARAGKPIAQIFAEQGEASFRALERASIAELAKRPQPSVLATGGGALVDETNFRVLSESGVVICLTARPEVIARRVRRSSVARPMLEGGERPLEEKIAELMDRRRAAYARALLTIDTSDLSIERVAERIIEALRAEGLRDSQAPRDLPASATDLGHKPKP